MGLKDELGTEFSGWVEAYEEMGGRRGEIDGGEGRRG